MYDFQPRLPVDHVLAAVRLIRAGNPPRGDILKLAGAAVGEVGALLAQGPIFSLDCEPSTDIEAAIAALESIEFSREAADPQFDITPYLPYILMLIEWLIKRRQG